MTSGAPVAAAASAPGEHDRAVRALRWRRMLAPAGVAVAAGTVVALVATVDPNEPGNYPTCPFLFVSGHVCPGCGTLRTLHALAHGDLPTALSLNVLTVLAIPLLVSIWWRWSGRQWQGVPRTTAAPAWRIWTLLVVVLVFWLLRNLPGFELLAP